MKARGSIPEINHPRVGKLRVAGMPVKLSATPGSIRTHSPMLGEHTDEVLRDMLGMNATDIAALRAQGGLGNK